MRINHNIPALNAHRLLNVNTGKSSKVLERLSSGKKINRAADDAAGMAISEKMRAQVMGLRKASQNTLDGISLIQTAEGAMNEVHSMFQRMRELSVQAANGAVTDEDRQAIQDEINQLTSEVNRIANGTNFNTRKLLQGNTAPNSNTTVHRMSTGGPAEIVGDQALDDTYVGDIADLSTKTLTITIDGEERTVNLNKFSDPGNATVENILGVLNDAMGDLGEAIITDNARLEIRSASIGGGSKIEITGTLAADLFGTVNLGTTGEAEKDAGNATGSFLFKEIPQAGSTMTIGKEKIEFFDSRVGPYTGSNRPINIAKDATDEKDLEDLVKEIAALGIDGVNMTIDANKTTRLIVTADVEGFAGQAIFLEGTPKEFVTNLQVGPNQGQGFRLSIGDIRAKILGISSASPDGNTGVKGAAFTSGTPNVTDGLSEGVIEYALDVSKEDRATAAITVYDNAIVKLAGLRSSLGAIQNRLEYTTANLDNTAENLTAALSRIEDADMALEMSEFTKLNILTQSGVAMLAQANQRPQSVLQLLGS
ncbi:flagellin [Anaerovirgula multivorans]|uniref:Flagellin n=1 Tax=Anaerovirgula multivorans TaxID=312168 RepID=A0A239EWA5_9FIRM|nr:flagellin [Anaerovirgula multivorans]SNS48094.1 flagellin [Anaerovirgula multivorans]